MRHLSETNRQQTSQLKNLLKYSAFVEVYKTSSIFFNFWLRLVNYLEVPSPNIFVITGLNLNRTTILSKKIKRKLKPPRTRNNHKLERSTSPKNLRNFLRIFLINYLNFVVTKKKTNFFAFFFDLNIFFLKSLNVVSTEFPLLCI